MASSKDRQRKLARAKLDRQMARRAATTRRKRQIKAGIGSGLAVLLVVLGTVWLLGGFQGDKDTDDEAAVAKDECVWSDLGSANPNLKDVGRPPTDDIAQSGTVPMTVVTPDGDITANLDIAASPCGVANMSFLASKKFYNGTTCHELHPTFLRCGDPSGTGLGGPNYSFYGENVPEIPQPAPAGDPSPSPGATASPGTSPSPGSGASPDASPSPSADTAVTYKRGTVALIAGTPGNFGSQFVIFHKDYRTTEPTYSIIGNVIGGLPVLDKIVAAGTVDNGSGQNIKPAKEVTVRAVNVAEVFDESPPPTPTGDAGASPSPTAPAPS